MHKSEQKMVKRKTEMSHQQKGKLAGCSPELIYQRDVMCFERRSDRLGELEIKKGI